MSSDGLAPHQVDFLDLAISRQVLRFGQFTLKSGRLSPYFFNAGHFSDGESMKRLGDAMAKCIVDSGVEFDVLFGPAYKGIPLVTCIAQSMFALTGRNCPFAFNRKEPKDHGEGGLLVGAEVKGKRVLVIDDVITAGTAIREALGMLEGAHVVAVCVTLDRQEKGKDSELSAVQAVEKEFGFGVLGLVKLEHILAYVKDGKGDFDQRDELVAKIVGYRASYGV